MEVHFRIFQICKKLNHVEQIEADIEFSPCPGGMNCLAGLFLFSVIALDKQFAFLEKPAHAVEFFIGENLHTPKSQKKFFSIKADALRIRVFCRHDALIIREFPFNQLRNEFNIVEFEADLRIAQIDNNR